MPIELHQNFWRFIDFWLDLAILVCMYYTSFTKVAQYGLAICMCSRMSNPTRTMDGSFFIDHLTIAWIATFCFLVVCKDVIVFHARHDVGKL